jgi:hypothetical protein
MNHRRLHFRPALDIEKLRLGAAAHFGIEPARVFVYFDATDIWGSDEHDPDPAQVIAFNESDVRVLVRRFAPDTGPIEGWLSFDFKDGANFDEAALAQALAAAAGVAFYYVDPIPDIDDEPGAEAAQIEASPDGRTRHVWVTEYGDEGQTRTDVSGRGADEERD